MYQRDRQCWQETIVTTFNAGTFKPINNTTKAKAHAFHDICILCTLTEMRWQHSESWLIGIESSKISPKICIAYHREFPIHIKNFSKTSLSSHQNQRNWWWIHSAGCDMCACAFSNTMQMEMAISAVFPDNSLPLFILLSLSLLSTVD